MIKVLSNTYNPFQENTYILYDETRECIIIDPGCYSKPEKDHLKQVIEGKNLKPVHLINTHCHLDHVFGNAFVHETYGLAPQLHEEELPVYRAVPKMAELYGVPVDTMPDHGAFLKEGATLTFGDSALDILFTPGHAPGEVSLFAEAEEFVIAGDVLFRESIGRTDLPGGDFDTLIKSIKEVLFPLGDEVTVYCGHGPSTTIGYEKKNNPFLR